jgi:hypothetical protein
MDFTINIIYVILVGLGVLLTVIAIVVKSSRESERFESWLKTHEKEIQDLRIENKAIRESQALQNSTFMSEIRKVEHLMNELKISNAIIQNTLNILIKNTSIKPQDHEG